MTAPLSSWLALRTCVAPEGRFVHGIHQPHFDAVNLREEDYIMPLGLVTYGRPHLNHANFPPHDVHEPGADTIYEIPNPFPFRGVTFICKSWADQNAARPERIAIAAPAPVSLHRSIQEGLGESCDTPDAVRRIFENLPMALQLAVATTSTDPHDLVLLAKTCCHMVFDETTGRPLGMEYENGPSGLPRPRILDEHLFDAVANNPHLPDDYKQAMVLRPGVQGGNEIVGEWRAGQSHVFEYLRRNSYIPWGHYAANMAHDAVRYSVGSLTMNDITGMRHLYYQRTYVRLAADLQAAPLPRRQCLSVSSLEHLRTSLQKLVTAEAGCPPLPFNATLWGWNYGFDYAPSGYRLHASHQQIHQQFAMVPGRVAVTGSESNEDIPGYACGDMVGKFIAEYRQRTGADFFESYLQAMRTNTRLDGRIDKPADLIVYEDGHVILFVPKAQTSQWELQLIPLAPVGNILEADTVLRNALDRGLYIAMGILSAMGATMITVCEYSKRLDNSDTDQRLFYDFLPRIPQSPGAFSEAQLRWISGHYPEDFALACRMRLEEVLKRA
jgi:hypothetical protein